MKCRTCQAEIAEKAIVCYRCGTPTADLAPVPRTAPPPARPRWWMVPIILAIIALGAWLVPMTPGGTPGRWAAWAAVAVATFVAVWLARRPRARR